MSRTRTINISGKEFELFFSVSAMVKIGERCGGDFDRLGDWLSEAGTTAETVKRFGGVLTDLINGAIIKRNADKALGLADGEREPHIPEEVICAILSPAELIDYKQEIFAALNNGADFEVPEGVTIEEKDADLKEMEEERRKNSGGASI